MAKLEKPVMQSRSPKVGIGDGKPAGFSSPRLDHYTMRVRLCKPMDLSSTKSSARNLERELFESTQPPYKVQSTRQVFL